MFTNFERKDEKKWKWPEMSVRLVLTLSTGGKLLRPLMTFANNFDPDEAQQNVGPNLNSTLFDTQDYTPAWVAQW